MRYAKDLDYDCYSLATLSIYFITKCFHEKYTIATENRTHTRGSPINQNAKELITIAFSIAKKKKTNNNQNMDENISSHEWIQLV